MQRGEVYSYTVTQALDGHPNYPGMMVLALVELESGGLVTTELTDLDRDWDEEDEVWRYPELEIGVRVEEVTRLRRKDGMLGDDERGMLVYGYKFRPILEKSE